jgi:hypothetical protein
MEPSIHLLYQPGRKDHSAGNRGEGLDVGEHEEVHRESIKGKGMNSKPWRKMILSSLLFLLSFLITQCAAQKAELETHGEMPSTRMFPPDHIFSLAEVRLEKVFEENRGMIVLEENATTVRDYYRGGVQEKEKGEGRMQEGKWEEAEGHFKKSNSYLKVVTEYLPEDEPYRNVYEDHFVIFLPNLIMADNQLKLAEIYGKTNRKGDIYWAIWQGQEYLSQSLKTAKTEWAFQIEKEFQEQLAPK